MNKEIESLQKLLQNLVKSKKDLLLLIITFHNLESLTIEKFVKNNRKKAKIQQIEYPKQDEVTENPRSRSARLLKI